MMSCAHGNTSIDLLTLHKIDFTKVRYFSSLFVGLQGKDSN